MWRKSIKKWCCILFVQYSDTMLKSVRIFQWSIIIAIIHSYSQRAHCCLTDEETNSQWYFSTLTSYNCVSHKEINVPADTPIQLFMVTKHGTSNPLWDDYKEKHYYQYQMTDKLEISENAEMSETDIEKIKSWKPKSTTDYVEGLAVKGHDEIIELAERIENAFPQIFTEEYNTENYYVLTRPEQNCKETGQLFLKTIFYDKSIDTVPVCDQDDKILMINYYMKTCPKVMTMHNNELKYFLYSDDIKNVVRRILKKIGREYSEQFEDRKLVFSLYNTCAIESSHDEKSIPPLCRLFSKDDLDVLEYMKDLIYYFDEGYGNLYSVKYACPMAIRLLESFENKIQGRSQKGIFYFGNSINILNLYVMLGLAKDDFPLMSSNYESMKDRKWKSSLMAPLAANFMAVLFKSDKNEYKVAFYFNEKLTTITLNDGTPCEVCLWSEIKKKLEKYINDYSCTSVYNNMLTYPSYLDSHPYLFFTTKTAYRLVSPEKIEKAQSDTPVQMFAVMRHDFTLPPKDFVKEWSRYNVYKFKMTARATMSWSDIDSIHSWRWCISNKEKNNRDNLSRDKIESLADRIKQAFPNLFNEPYSLENFKVLSRSEQICKDTGEIFLQRLFKDKSITSVSDWENDNQLLMVGELNENESKNMYIEELKKTDIIKNVQRRVAIKMGLEPGALDKDFDFINYAYKVCRFESSFGKYTIPPLCKIFCPEDLKALEYIDDLSWYYTAGYGNRLNLQQACPMAKSLLETLITKIKGCGPKGAFNFGNAHNIFNLYVILGLAKDNVPLTPENYKYIENREWRTSLLVPLLATFMAVLFKIDKNKYKVAFYFNEKRMIITLNDGTPCEVCPWSEIKKKLEKYINDHNCTPVYNNKIKNFFKSCVNKN